MGTMRTIRAIGCAVALFIFAACGLADGATDTLHVATDRPDAVYKRGETVVFHVSAPQGWSVQYKLSKDGVGDLGSGTLDIGDQPADVKSSLDEPGVIRCEVTHATSDSKKPVSAIAGAAIDTADIKPSLPVPEDFDAFWQKQKERLAAEPAQPVLTKVATTRPGVECYDVQINCPGGAPVSGYLAIPKDAKPHSLAAILYTHSAGISGGDLPHAIKGAKLGLLALDINAHGIPNGKPDKFYEDLSNGALRDYPGRGVKDRETVYFLGMYLRVMRALDFLTARPEWDGKILIAEGSSQGGGQSLVAAGLDPRVTLCFAAVPAMCDHTGFVVGRACGWPRLVPKDADGKYDETATQVSRYVDNVNFATHIKCPIYVTTGYIDKTCPASSVFAAYNNIPVTTEKHLIVRPTMGHAFPADLIARFDQIIVHYVSLVHEDAGLPESH